MPVLILFFAGIIALNALRFWLLPWLSASFEKEAIERMQKLFALARVFGDIPDDLFSRDFEQMIFRTVARAGMGPKLLVLHQLPLPFFFIESSCTVKLPFDSYQAVRLLKHVTILPHKSVICLCARYMIVFMRNDATEAALFITASVIEGNGADIFSSLL